MRQRSASQRSIASNVGTGSVRASFCARPLPNEELAELFPVVVLENVELQLTVLSANLGADHEVIPGASGLRSQTFNKYVEL